MQRNIPTHHRRSAGLKSDDSKLSFAYESYHYHTHQTTKEDLMTQDALMGTLRHMEF